MLPLLRVVQLLPEARYRNFRTGVHLLPPAHHRWTNSECAGSPGIALDDRKAVHRLSIWQLFCKTLGLTVTMLINQFG